MSRVQLVAIGARDTDCSDSSSTHMRLRCAPFSHALPRSVNVDSVQHYTTSTRRARSHRWWWWWFLISVVVARVGDHQWVHHLQQSLKSWFAACGKQKDTVDMAASGAPRVVRAAFDLGSGGIKVVVAEVAPVLGAAGQMRVTRVRWNILMF